MVLEGIQGYPGHLSEEQDAKLADIKRRVPAIVREARKDCPSDWKGPMMWGVDLSSEGFPQTVVLLKYLRAEEFDVDKAEERLVKTLIWRAECNVDYLKEAELPEAFLGHDVISGHDVDGRPVFLSRFGGMDLDKVFGDAEAFVRYRVKLMEQAIDRLKFEPDKPEDLCQVHDYSGVPLSGFGGEVKSCVNLISKIFADHYPEFKGKTVFVNFPAVFTTLFSAFSVFLPERTKKKFVILGDDPSLYFEHIPPDTLPVTLGGAHEDNGREWKAKCQVVRVGQWSSTSHSGVKVEGAATIAWECRVCKADLDIAIEFEPASDPKNAIKVHNQAGRLDASDGLLSGEYRSTEAGTLLFRLSNKFSMFTSKTALCRSEVVG